ncbi:MAG: carbohydrate binding family 9 domain-containing protein [Bacteroidales bacterium]|nr:carbohydrate binding family 9 domain-containing protein [Bacteroidales bacterium]MCF8391804.1 carbohydrate binding family 9 domain-containing protein [Bacteroidales bacterium]
MELRLLFFLVCLFCVSITGFSQKEISVGNYNAQIVVDGILDENIWSELIPAQGFIQLEPEKGKAASENTEVFCFYDNDNIYFAFKCYQTSSIVANVQVRDELEDSDDAVLILIDTYNDGRTAFGFSVNPLNTQSDMRVNDDGNTLNRNWDAIWYSATSVSDDYWIAEFSIPFSSLKYKSGSDIWGINFSRLIRSGVETSYWSGVLSNDYRISQAGLLKGIQPPKQEDKITLTPYASLRYENSDITGKYNSYLPQAGMDLSYIPMPNITFSGTLNPDFASVEGDKEQIDLSGWEEGFPEKRIFFQEGNEMFDTRYKLFYSRRIGDINYGTKLAGKVGDYSFNAIHARSLKNETLAIPGAFYTVGSVKKDILKSSSVGAIIVDKTTDTSSVKAFGIDWNVNQGQYWKITGQLMGSTPGDFMENFGGFMRVAHESKKHHIHLRYSDLGENLKENINQSGFVYDDDRRELDSDVSYRFWLNKTFLRYIYLVSANNAYWDHNGDFNSSRFSQFVRFYTKSKFSLEFRNENESRRVEVEDMDYRFRNTRMSTELGYNIEESNKIEIEMATGMNFDRRYSIIEGDIEVSPFRKLSLAYSFANLDFETDQTSELNLRLEESTFLNILTLNYYFTNNLWLRVLLQNDSYKERNYFYGQFGWRFKPPFGALYIIYAGDDFYNHSESIYYSSKTVFLKLTYPLSF